MKQEKIDNFFASKGIKTIYNCLGATDRLVRSYVSNFKPVVDTFKTKHSYDNKIQTYTRLYQMDFRHKHSGFEKFKDIDKNFRKELSQFVREAQFSPAYELKNSESDNLYDYKVELRNFVKTIEDPLLYLSGGLDSELVALAMLDAGIKFKVVIFDWVKNGQVYNKHESVHAYNFCKKHSIKPIVKHIEIEKLWQSQYFKNLAVELQILSPQLVTHAHMINLMSQEYPCATHIFGGEIKFKTNYLSDDGTLENLVWLLKTLPEYDFQQYETYWTGNTADAEISLNYNTGVTGDSNSFWFIAANGGEPLQILDIFGGGLTSGVWASYAPGDPVPSYQYRGTASALDIIGSQIAVVSTSYTTITPNSNYALATVIAFGQPTFNFISRGQYLFNLEVRTASQPGIVQTSTITMLAQSTTSIPP